MRDDDPAGQRKLTKVATFQLFQLFPPTARQTMKLNFII